MNLKQFHGMKHSSFCCWKLCTFKAQPSENFDTRNWLCQFCRGFCYANGHWSNKIIKAMLAIQQWAAICCQRNTVLNEMHLEKHYYKGKRWVINLKQWAMETCFLKCLLNCLKILDMLTEIPERFSVTSYRGGFNFRFITPKLYHLGLPVMLSFWMEETESLNVMREPERTSFQPTCSWLCLFLFWWGFFVCVWMSFSSSSIWLPPPSLKTENQILLLAPYNTDKETLIWGEKENDISGTGAELSIMMSNLEVSCFIKSIDLKYNIA